MTVSAAQIAAQLDAVLNREPDVRAVAIRSPVQQDWPDTINRGGRRFGLRWCESLLAIREALVDDELSGTPASGVLVLTPFGTHQLPDDVAARLAKARVYEPQGWDTVRELFSARELDARLARYSWMPQLLIEASVGAPYPPVASGFLDLETAWGELLGRCLAISSGRPDSLELLLWSQQPQSSVTLGALPPSARADVLKWLADAAGSVGAWIVACIEAGRKADALPLGIVCDVVFSPQGEGLVALAQAAVRLEQFVGGQHVGTAHGRAWAESARRLIERESAARMRGALERADALLQTLQATQFAHLSDMLPRGLDDRLGHFADTLHAQVEEPGAVAMQQVEQAAASVQRHLLARDQHVRMERVQMARRLSRWLLRPIPTTAGMDELLAWHTDEGAYVDWARFRLLGGDEVPDLSRAYGALRACVAARLESVGHRFAASMKDRARQGDMSSARAIPVENILDKVVAPLAEQNPVLLLVIDGLSVAVFRELFERMERHGWGEIVAESTSKPLSGVAVLPTVTEVSRASLLCGRIAVGNSNQEKTGFASHAALLTRSHTTAPPRLFHKGDLAEGGNLAQEIRQAVSNPQQRVLGVVYNAVDDYLGGPQQLQQRWVLEDLRLLLPLFREAHCAGRIVVVTADHGHVLEDGSLAVGGGVDSDRWRPGKDAVHEGEVALTGPRVLTAEGSHEAVCLWSQPARYSTRKNGYHGGASLPEVTVPLSVLAPLGMALSGWQPATPPQPDWWDLPLLAQQPREAATPAKRPPAKRVQKTPDAQAGLFTEAELPPASSPATPSTDWIAQLMNSATYVSQRQLAARVAPPDAQLRALLLALDERGGKLSRAALAQRLNIPELRIGGLLSAARRVLNVDQVIALDLDELTGTVELNIAVLKQQFGISGTGDGK